MSKSMAAPLLRRPSTWLALAFFFLVAAFGAASIAYLPPFQETFTPHPLLGTFALTGAVAAAILWLAQHFWVLPRYQVGPVLARLARQQALEAELQQKHAELQAIYNHAPIMMVLVDGAGTILFSNPAFTSFVDPRHGSCVGMRLGDALDCVHASETEVGCGFARACAQCGLRAAIRATLSGASGRHAFEHETTLLRDGVPQRVCLLGSSVRLEMGGETNVLICLQDVTARQQAEAALRESEEQKELVLEAATGGWWDWDLVHGRLYYSTQWFGMLGYQPGELPTDQEMWQRITHPEDMGRVMLEFQSYLESDAPAYEIEVRFRHAAGHYVPVRSRARIVRDESGQAIRVCGFNVDLSSQKERDTEYRGLIQTSMDGFWVLDPQGAILQVNGAICRMLDYDEAELLQLRISDLEASETPDEVARHVQRIIEIGHDRFESRLRRKNGDLLDIEVSASALPGLSSHFYVFLRDISGRKAFEASLRASEARFRSYIEHAPIGVVVVDGEGHYKDANEAAARSGGYSREEFMRMSVRDLLIPEDRRAARAFFARLLSGGGECTELRIRHKDGTTVPIEVHATRLDANLFLGFHIELAERKKAESAILHQSALDAVLAEVSQAMLAEHHPTNLGSLILRHAMRLTGSTSAGLLSSLPDSDRVSIIDENDRVWALEDHVDEHIEAVWRQLGPVYAPCTTSIPCGEGPCSGTPCSALVLPIVQQGEWVGQIVLACAPEGYSALDLTALGRLAELYRLHLHGAQIKRELETSRLQFLQAQKMEAIGRLAGGVAHDFNNILGVIIGYSEFMLRGPEGGQEFREQVEAVRKAAQRGADLTRQLLAFARKQAAQPRLVDLNESVGGMLKLLGRLAGENIAMRWHPANRTLPIRIDPSQLDQLLANLVVNARDAIAGSGSITITAATEFVEADTGRRAHDPAPGDYGVLEVKDSGCGMDEDVLNRIFEPFFTTKPEGQGTGLGLATVHGIVHQNGGFLTTASQVGQGTAFRIFLPLVDAGTAEPTAPRAGGAGVPVGNETILLVDDQSDFREACRRILECLGYRVIAARDGEDAIALLDGEAEKIQLLITDVVMPGINGRELWRRLSAKSPRLRCIFMSGYTADVIGQQGMMDEGICFIDKPFSMSTLAQRIREVLDA